MISSKNIFYHELIGLELKVVDSSNPSLIGLCGTVIDETKKTLLVEVKEKVPCGDLGSNQENFNFICGNNCLSCSYGKWNLCLVKYYRSIC